MSEGLISSPVSTGGAGPFFEQHVNAYWLALLLVRAIPPILLDCTVKEVQLQTKHLGWHTDDSLICCQDNSGRRHILASQVKRTFTVSANDPECKKTMQNFWKDFNNSQIFSPDRDRFALITRFGTTTLLQHFGSLLDCARASRDEADFKHRLGTPGFINNKSIRYCNEIRKIIGEIEGKDVSVCDVWPFLCVLHVMSLDLASVSGQDEAKIKSLLAHTVGEPGEVGIVDATWNELLREAGQGMSAARGYRREDLPKELRQRHAQTGDTEKRALQMLNEHSIPILDGIRSTIGEFQLDRSRLVQQAIEHLESNQVVLISGVAGIGKSVIAKNVYDILRKAGYFAFSFRGEEFAHAHLDETLQTIQVPTTAARLGAILAGQNRKILLVESVERLLEKSTRDAFNDLLTLMEKDKSWRLLLTCRDYSTDLVRSAFLKPVNVSHSVVTIPPLDNEELEKVKAANPSLVQPLGDAALRQVLRNPYFLDKALRIQWSKERPLPQSEREFRTLVWRDIVRVDHRRAKSMPTLRENAFEQVALRRARALTMYVACDDLEREAIQELQNDSLLVHSKDSDSLLAPVHDVMEDWAILHWLQRQYLKSEGSLQALSAEIGTPPAVRRTYRKWVTELVESDPEAADELFQAVISEGEIPLHFRDDTLVSLLRSPFSSEFLERYAPELLANDCQHLRRLIHLLRVACVTTPAWLEPSVASASLFNAPEGPAWASVLRLAQAHFTSFVPKHAPLLLGLIQDWGQGVSWRTPYPEGYEAVAAIAHGLLPHFQGYRSEDQRKTILQVIAKIPNADRERFTALLRGSRADGDRDRTAVDFRKIIFEDMHGMPAARDMPALIALVAKDYLLCLEADLQSESNYGFPLKLETLFGIKGFRSHGFSPASACRGVFLPLLNYHPLEGLDLIIAVLNHSADWYARLRVRSEAVEPPFEMSLTFADGTSRTQWYNERLWMLYRGTSVGPDVLQSILMALEYWLLELAESDPHELDEMLLSIIRRSDSAALTAVAASVATAFPHESSETLLVLLQSRICIQLDGKRKVYEAQAPSVMMAMLPSLNGRDAIHEADRKKADARLHRKHDLESAILNLQLGSAAPRVHEMIDRHRAEMPPPEGQSEDDQIWRLALHRMDLRHYTVAEDAPEALATSEEPASHEHDETHIYLEPDDVDPDLQVMMSRNAARIQSINTRSEILDWGLNAFGHDEGTTYDPDQWKQKLQEARAVANGLCGEVSLKDRIRRLLARVSTSGAVEGSNDEVDWGRDGPGFVAVVCVRDHWNKMSDDERDWCVNIICSEIERTGNCWNELSRVQRNSMAANRPCAWALPLLLGRILADTQRTRVRQTFVLALTHPVDEVRIYAAFGIGVHLWTIDRELALRCVNALATDAILVQRELDANTNLVYSDRRNVDVIREEAASVVRKQFCELDGIADNAHLEFDSTRSYGVYANRPILVVLGQAPTEPAAIAAFERLAHTLVGWWNQTADERQKRNYKLEAELQQLLPKFLLRTPTLEAAQILQPILDSIERFPREIPWLVRALISAEDRQPNTAQFWSLWQLFADRVRCAQWLGGLDNEHATGGEMIAAIFLSNYWKEDVRHWRSLEGNAQHIHRLFADLPQSSRVLDAYVSFLYQIGTQSLPDAFIRIAQRLQQVDSSQIMWKGNTIYCLEVLLQRYVYRHSLTLKRKRHLRHAILFLLDFLIENGSSSAFRMRDDFVTPISTTH